MSKPTQAQSDLWDAVNTLDEVADEILFLSVAVATAWDDQPANGLVYILNRLRETVMTISGAIQETIKAMNTPPPPAPPVFEPTPEQEALVAKFWQDWEACCSTRAEDAATTPAA